MNGIDIDAEELIQAFESNHGEIQYVLDRQTGEVIPMPTDGSDFPIEDELRELIEANFGTRFIRIEPVTSSEGWNVMSSFVEQLPNSETASRLARVIEGKSPFRRFKDELLNYPKLREDWFRFHEEAFVKIAQEWLESHEIEAALKRRRQP